MKVLSALRQEDKSWRPKFIYSRTRGSIKEKRSMTQGPQPETKHKKPKIVDVVNKQALECAEFIRNEIVTCPLRTQSLGPLSIIRQCHAHDS